MYIFVALISGSINLVMKILKFTFLLLFQWMDLCILLFTVGNNCRRANLFMQIFFAVIFHQKIRLIRCFLMDKIVFIVVDCVLEGI